MMNSFEIFYTNLIEEKGFYVMTEQVSKTPEKV